MSSRVLLRKLEDFENPRIIRLGDNLFAASFFLMKLLPARFILERAAEQGFLKAGAPICESSSGTFGLALALLAAQYGYRLVLVSDWSLDRHLHRRLKELGAVVEIIDKPSPVGGFQQARLDRLHEFLRQIPDSYWPAQYSNPDNPLAYGKFAEQLIDRVGRIDCLIGPVGSGGSMCGTTRYLRAVFPEQYAIGVDTPNSVLFGQPSGKLGLAGLGGAILYENVDHTQFDEVHWLTGPEAFKASHRLHRKHSLFMGPTSGAAYRVAEWWSRRNPDKNVVVIFPDEGHRYVETVYDEEWLNNVSGWPPLWLGEPKTVLSPREPLAGWSRYLWDRRTLKDVLQTEECSRQDHQSAVLRNEATAI